MFKSIFTSLLHIKTICTSPFILAGVGALPPWVRMYPPMESLTVSYPYLPLILQEK